MNRSLILCGLLTLAAVGCQPFSPSQGTRNVGYYECRWRRSAPGDFSMTCEAREDLEVVKVTAGLYELAKGTGRTTFKHPGYKLISDEATWGSAHLTGPALMGRPSMLAKGQRFTVSHQFSDAARGSYLIVHIKTRQPGEEGVSDFKIGPVEYSGYRDPAAPPARGIGCSCAFR